MRVDVGVSSWRTKRGSKGSCCFFRGAKGPLNPSLYPAAAMRPKGCTSECVFCPARYLSAQEADRYTERSMRSDVPARPRGSEIDYYGAFCVKIIIIRRICLNCYNKAVIYLNLEITRQKPDNTKTSLVSVSRLIWLL